MFHIDSRTLTALLLATVCTDLSGKGRHRKDAPPPAHDEIVIEAHLDIQQGPILHFTATQHFGRMYVYAEREAGKPVMLIDVSKADHPQVLSETADSPGLTVGSLVTAAGTAALTSDSKTQIPPAAQIIKIMDFSDPAHPKVTRQFDGVTAVEKTGGLILLANPEGIWILSEHLATDPAVEAEYAHRVVYQ